jgi:tetratricopeptide (TPR) repeat protein
MTEGPSDSQPPRLRDEDGTAGSLLRGADESFRKGFVEGGAWQRLEQRRQRRRTATSWALGACAVAAAIAIVGLRSRSDDGELVVSPEPVPVSIPEGLGEPPTQVTAARPLEPSVLAPPRSPAVRVARKADQEPRSEASCRSLASTGEVEAAVKCFQDLSRGSGLGAEVALYEAARLSAERLQDPRRALRLLDEHQSRFSGSALRGEVEWLRVQSLDGSGRFDEALATSEALMATAAGRTLASELHFLRGRIYQDTRRDCARAVSEFVALVGEPGARGDEAEFRRATCLEELGRRDDARAAYERYLDRAAPASASKARERLRVLRPEGARSGE